MALPLSERVKDTENQLTDLWGEIRQLRERIDRKGETVGAGGLFPKTNYIVTTVDATPTLLYSFVPSTPGLYLVGGNVLATDLADDYNAWYVVLALVYCSSAGVVSTLGGLVVSVAEYEDRVDWDAVIQVVGGTSVDVIVTGEAATTIKWTLTPSSGLFGS